MSAGAHSPTDCQLPSDSGPNRFFATARRAGKCRRRRIRDRVCCRSTAAICTHRRMVMSGGNKEQPKNRKRFRVCAPESGTRPQQPAEQVQRPAKNLAQLFLPQLFHEISANAALLTVCPADQARSHTRRGRYDHRPSWRSPLLNFLAALGGGCSSGVAPRNSRSFVCHQRGG